MNSFDLLRAYIPHHTAARDGAAPPGPMSQVVAVGDTGSRTVADLLYDVACVRAQLTAGDGEILVTCQDRYYLAVTLLAAWSEGRVVALPPNAREQTLQELAAHCTFALHDGAGPGQNMLAWLQTRPTHAPLPPLPPIPEQQTIVTIYTSGSSGAPTACKKSAGQLLGEGDTLQRTFLLSRDSCVLATVPAHHIYGLLFSILLPMAAGARFVRETPLLTPVIEDSARRHQANVLVSVPAHLRVLSESQLTSLASVRRIFSSGAPLADATAHELHRRFQVGVYEILGSTETGGFAHRRADADGARFRPFAGVTITSDDEQALCLCSPLLDPSIAQPLVCPDRIELNADGSFRHLGRSDGVIKVGGTRMSLAELETRVRGLPEVLDVAALAVDAARARGHEIWLVIASERGQELPELRAHLLRYYEPVLLPRRVRFIDALPREANGKLMRARLLELFRSSKSESTQP